MAEWTVKRTETFLAALKLVKKFRLIFSIDEKKRIVYLEALDHRETVY